MYLALGFAARPPYMCPATAGKQNAIDRNKRSQGLPE